MPAILIMNLFLVISLPITSGCICAMNQTEWSKYGKPYIVNSWSLSMVIANTAFHLVMMLNTYLCKIEISLSFCLSYYCNILQIILIIYLFLVLIYFFKRKLEKTIGAKNTSPG